jgi:hypothetical protein
MYFTNVSQTHHNRSDVNNNNDDSDIAEEDQSDGQEQSDVEDQSDGQEQSDDHDQSDTDISDSDNESDDEHKPRSTISLQAFSDSDDEIMSLTERLSTKRVLTPLPSDDEDLPGVSAETQLRVLKLFRRV